MSAIIIWILAIGLSTAGLTVAAALKLQYLHMVITAAVSVFMALAAIAEMRRAESNDARAAISLRHLGLVWTWVALNLFVTYAYILMWRPWMSLFIACFLSGGLCLFLASTLQAARDAGAQDQQFARMARLIAIVQLVVTAIALAALALETFLWQSIDTRLQGWAAGSLCLFGALAIAAISLNALRAETEQAPAHLSPGPAE
jgi:hypothetical protein